MSNTVTLNPHRQLSTNAVPRSIGFVAPLPKFATRVRPVGPPRTGRVECPFVAATSATAADVTNYQSGDTTLDNVALDVQALTKRSHISAPEGRAGLGALDLLRESLVNDFEKDVFAMATAQITAVAYGAADVSEVAANLTTANVKSLIAACAGNPRLLMLATAAFNSISGDLKLDASGLWRFPGIDAGVFEATLAGDAHTVLAGPTALVYHMEKPDASGLPPGDIKIAEIVLPRLQVPAWTCQWYDKASRSWWLSVEGLFGAAPAEVGALAFAAAP